MRRTLLLVMLSPFALATVGCAGDSDPAPMMAEGPIPQGDPNALFAWLQGGGYDDWEAESAVHPGAGPHFGSVRTFFNDMLIDSLAAEADEHPIDSASVKELYGQGTVVAGWAVSIKVAEMGDQGRGWYWYEYYDGSVIVDGEGVSTCTGCHSPGRDTVLSPFPLQ